MSDNLRFVAGIYCFLSKNTLKTLVFNKKICVFLTGGRLVFDKIHVDIAFVFGWNLAPVAA